MPQPPHTVFDVSHGAARPSDPLFSRQRSAPGRNVATLHGPPNIVPLASCQQALAIRFQQSSLPSLYRIPFSRMSADILEPVSAGFDLNTAFGEQHRPVPHICMQGLSNLHNPPTTFLQICVQTLSRIQRLMTRVMLVTTSTFASNRCVRFSRSALSTISADWELCMAPITFPSPNASRRGTAKSL